MRNLIRFLIQHHFTLLFLFLEMLAIGLLLRFNSFHNAKIFKIKHSIIGSISDKYKDYSRYLSLSGQNQKLVEENARLYNMLPSSHYSLKDESFTDTNWIKNYKFIPAKVINNSVNKQYNFITINKGSVNGIRSDMGVICSDGLVGVVKNVNKYYSSVVPVLNRDFFPHAKIKNSNYFGPIEWPGKNYQKVILKDIPLHADIHPGDTVVTSGFTATFPEGINVGTIINYEIEEGVNYNVQVKLSADFKKIYNVWVIDNLLRKYLQAIQDSTFHD
jgi:rod shape-determining protein MreC